MIDVAGVRAGVTGLLSAALPADVTVAAWPPEDVVRTPMCWVDAASLSRSNSINGGTAVNLSVFIVATRTGTRHAVDLLDRLTASAWDALGSGGSTAVAGGQLFVQTADVQSIDAGDVSWPAVRLDCVVEVGVTC